MFFFLMFLAIVFSAPVDIVVHKDNNPLVKGVIAQPNFVKNLIKNKTLLSDLAEADPDTLRSILGLLEGLVSVSEAASLKFTTDVNEAAQVKATKSDTLVVAVQTVVDATAAVAAAQRALTAAEVAKATATTNKNIAQGEYNEADSHHTAMVKERTDKQPGVDAETVTMNKAIVLIESLIPGCTFTSKHACEGSILGDFALDEESCVTKCRATLGCNCVTMDVNPAKRCRLESGTTHTHRGSNVNYSAVTMEEC